MRWWPCNFAGSIIHDDQNRCKSVSPPGWTIYRWLCVRLETGGSHLPPCPRGHPIAHPVSSTLGNYQLGFRIWTHVTIDWDELSKIVRIKCLSNGWDSQLFGFNSNHDWSLLCRNIFLFVFMKIERQQRANWHAKPWSIMFLIFIFWYFSLTKHK